MMIHVGAGGGGGGLSSPVTITVDHTKCGTADTTGFVMLFSSTDASFKSTANGGSIGNSNDIRFAADNAGVTLYNWEIAKWDGTAGTITARVKVPTLAHASDTLLYLLYDGTGRGSFLGGSAGSVWDANYKTMIGGGDGSTLDLTDHTTNANNGTNNGSATAAAGPNGLGAISFVAASSQYISTPNTINIANPTMELLVNVPTTASGGLQDIMGIVQGNGGGTADKDIQIGNTSGELRFYTFGGGEAVGSTNIGASAWHHIACLNDGSQTVTYLDGTQYAIVTGVGGTFAGYSGPGLQINGLFHSGSYGTFKSCEHRLSNIARSASYVLATSNSFLSPSTFYTLS